MTRVEHIGPHTLTSLEQRSQAHAKRLREVAADARKHGWQISDHILPHDAEQAADIIEKLCAAIGGANEKG